MPTGSDAHSPATQNFNLLGALFVHVFVGLPLLVAVSGIAAESGVLWGLLWGGCTVVLWIGGLVRSTRRRSDLGAAWGAIVGSWLLAALGPIGAAYAAYFWRKPPPVQEDVSVNREVERRLDQFALRLEELTRELAEIRRLAEGVPVAEPEWGAPPTPPPATAPSPPPPPPPASKPRERSIWDRDVDFSGLLGAKGLAWAGGIVTVLGVVFFFVLAVNRGWIGPVERVGLGALASLLVFTAGLWLHRRYGPTYSAYGAVGAGIAGGYATLVAAAALYGLVSDLGALAIAAGIASVGLATSLVWRSELVAGLGLVGATLIPMMVLVEEDLSPLGTGFAGIVFAATAAVAVARRWQWLLASGFLASLVQIAILVADGGVNDWDRVVLAAFFMALYVGAAVAFHWASGTEGLPTLSATLVVVAGVLSGATGAALFAGDDRGWAILAAALAFGAAAAALFPLARDRDLSALLGAVALALAAVGLAVVLTGPSLAIAWAAEAAVLAWLARRIAEPRYSLAALAYLGAAAIDAVIEAPPEHLYEAVSDPARGALAPLAVALGGAVVAFYSRPWPDLPAPRGFFAYLEPLTASFRASHELWRGITGWLAGIAAVYAASLGTLTLTQALDDSSVELAFERGHVLVTGLWGLVALGLVLGGRRLASVHLRVAGLLLAGATFVQASTFYASELAGDRLGMALLVAAVGLLSVAFADALPVRAGESPVWASLLAAGSMGLAFFGVAQLVGDPRNEGLAWLGLAALYGALAAPVLRRERDFATMLWGLGAIVGAIGFATVWGGNWLVLAWSATAAALAVLGARVDEERLAFGSAGYLALAAGYTLGDLAAPSDFFSANAEPAAGVPSIAFVVGAALVSLLYGRLPERWDPFRAPAVAGIAVLAIYALSLTILGLFQWAGLADVETDFQRGHSAVSAFWGVIGLATLYVGLTRELRTLRLAGFGLFGLALAKLFLYDLANLSSITRALSFLAVGAVLLLAGFFYQRLTAEIREA
jgi:Predicted membrane protein (DUF2339)